MAGEYYADFINEAFVKPIRSVLIVDDDYPTFDEMLDSQIAKDQGEEYTNEKAWYTNPVRIKNVIANFRKPERPLLVDIHDGTNVAIGEDVKVAAHLHQSDLLVLDFQLDRAKPGDGSRAIEIVRSLNSNDHFNLVVVHTSEDIEIVFQDVLIGLLPACVNALLPEEVQGAELLLEASEDVSEGISARLNACVSVEHYLHSRQHPSTYLRTMMKVQQPDSNFNAVSEQAGWNPDNKKLVLRYLLDRVKGPLLAKLNPLSPKSLAWSSSPIKWIRTDSLFVAFSKKGEEDDILGDLQLALQEWNPQPSRLFLAKLRAEMDERGVIAQTQALGNRHALAHWYRRLLKATGEERRWLIAESVSRHSDQLMGAILHNVEEFATRLMNKEVASDDHDKLCKEHFKVDLTKESEILKAEREHNAFVCSKQPQGWHLTTGHVFTMNDDYWVCLSPACDTVPSQMSAAHIASFGTHLPFLAIRLHGIADNKVLKDVQTNRYVFLELDSVVKVFCFDDRSGENSAPAWQILFAGNKGIFEGEFAFNVTNTILNSGSLGSKTQEARVVSQLRYEYALNLMQRLGTSITRIGLDFT